MNPDDLARILDELGERLGPTGEYVFALAVRQVYVDAIVGAVLFAAATLVGLIVGPRLLRWRFEDDSSYSSRELVLVFVGFAYLVVLGVLTIGALYLIPPVLNPEYAALRDILSSIGGAR